MTPHPQPKDDNMYRITRWDLEEYYDAIAHINGKPDADRMWERIERNTRTHTPAAPATEPRYAPCPHTGIFTECYNRQAGCKYQKIIATEDTTDVTCSFQSSEPATELEESEQWRRVYENGYTDGQQAEREKVIQQFIDFGMSGKCVKTDKAVSCDAICERDCFVCFAESLRGGAP